MTKLRRLFLCLLAISIVSICSTVYGQTKSSPVAPSAQPSQTPTNVLVVDPSNQPVPVSLIGNLTVGLDAASNTVKIDSSSAVKIRDVNAGTPASFHTSFDGGIATGAWESFDVPANKMLVVEYVSVRVTGAVSTEHVRAMIQTAAAPFGVLFQRHFLVPTAIANDDFIFSAPVKMYFGPDESVGIGVQRSAAGASMLIEVSMSGRLIDTP